MPSFKDNEGRQWDVSINIGNVGLVERGTGGFSLYKVLDDKAKSLGELLENLPLFATVVYLLCKKKADERGVSDYEFAEAIAGDCLTDMRDAFIGALVDFFPDARRRALLAKMMESGRKAEESAMLMVEKATATMDTQAIADSTLTGILNEASMSALEQ